MRKVFLYVAFIMMVLLPLNVFAEEYKEKTLIPVDTTATVKTEKFDYNDFVYSSQVDAKGNSMITFGSIKNNNLTSTFVSINLLLFDSNKKNIGLVAYCTDKDINSSYYDFKLLGEQSAPFSIKVVSKYFVDGKTAKDVKYVAVLDYNPYCHIGGYDKYKGLTIDEIVNGISKKKTSELQKIFIYIQEHNYQGYIIYGLVGIVVLIVYGMILNSLHNKMYAKTNALAYIPGFNLYITVKLAFGKIIGLIYLLLLVAAGVLFYFKVPFVLYIVLGIAALAFIIDIIKIITKNYHMLCLEPAIKTNTYKFGDNATTYTNVGDDKGISEEALDLNYDDNGLNNNGFSLDEEAGAKTDDDDDEGESDLKKFFN